MQKKRQKSKNNAAPPTPSPTMLFQRGDYQGVISALSERMKNTAIVSDEEKRLLSRSVIRLNDTSRLAEALNYSSAIQKKDIYDYVRIGWCYLQLEDWQNAANAFEEAIKLDANYPPPYRLLAFAYSKGQKDYEWSKETKQQVESLLRRAINIPDCDIETFLWLEELQDWSVAGIQERIKILDKALQNHPDNEKARYKLAERYIYRTEDVSKGLSVLEPFLQFNSSKQTALWLAYEAHLKLENYRAALEQLDKLIAENNIPQLRIIKGIELIKRKEFEDARNFFCERIAR